MNGIKREQAVVQAAIDDMFYEMLDEWDRTCRAQSSTGENMVYESLGDDGYKDMCDRLMQRCIWKIARRLEEVN
jgi:hypothetical protein